MLPLFKSKPRYATVNNCEQAELKLGGEEDASAQYLTLRMGFCSALVVAALLLSSIASTWVLLFSSIFQHQARSPTTTLDPILAITPTSSAWVCQSPAARREWRTLSDTEREEYVEAVRCLATKPSKLRNTGTLYDDFPWVHKRLSGKTHKSAIFLPWHRQFISLYEKALKDECGFDGQLPYWDWSLDSTNFRGAPVWSTTGGLGGNGNQEGPAGVGEGHCVTDGPFANLTDLLFFDDDEQPHCLSRGFASEQELSELGELVAPAAINELVLCDKGYDHFEAELEHRAHKFLSQSIRGDLSRFTGPNDPVFWLHHTNLDRLWAEWQARSGIWNYGGRRHGESHEPASLADIMEFGGLSRTMPVNEVMETAGNQYCYQY